jgi:hypothetical protein
MNKEFNINFVIFSPYPEYVTHIGGATVPHTLANQLSLLGENVYVYSNTTNPKYNITCIPWGTEIDFDPENTIVIIIAGGGEHTFEHNIPECLKNAPNMVRWLVNDQNKYYPEGEKFYIYHKYWDVLENQKIDGELSVIEVDYDLFQDRGLKREGTCYLMKGNLDPNLEPERIIHKPEDICIDSILYNIPNFEKMKFYSDLFNKMEYFISYTPFTFTSVLAAMCGCKSIVIPRYEYDGRVFSKEKWLDEIWCAKYGIAVGLDDLPRAISTMDQVLPNIKYYEEVTQTNQAKDFIQDCYVWLKEKYNL